LNGWVVWFCCGYFSQICASFSFSGLGANCHSSCQLVKFWNVSTVWVTLHPISPHQNPVPVSFPSVPEQDIVTLLASLCPGVLWAPVLQWTSIPILGRLLV
jgi:hypothetical protein